MHAISRTDKEKGEGEKGEGAHSFARMTRKTCRKYYENYIINTKKTQKWAHALGNIKFLLLIAANHM